MVPLLCAAAALVLASPLVVAIMRANELFLLRIRDGEVRIARGKIPQRLFDDLSDVVRDPKTKDARLRGVSEGGRPRLYAEGDLSTEQKQRLRNVIGTWSLGQIRTAPRRR